MSYEQWEAITKGFQKIWTEFEILNKTNQEHYSIILLLFAIIIITNFAALGITTIYFICQKQEILKLKKQNLQLFEILNKEKTKGEKN